MRDLPTIFRRSSNRYHVLLFALAVCIHSVCLSVTAGERVASSAGARSSNLRVTGFHGHVYVKTDSSLDVVSGVTIEFTNLSSGTKATVASNAHGYFRTRLGFGTYSYQIEYKNQVVDQGRFQLHPSDGPPRWVIQDFAFTHLPGGRLSVEVVSKKDEKPLDSVNIVLRDKANSGSTVKPNDEQSFPNIGQFTFEVTGTAREFELYIQRVGYRAKSRSVSISSDEVAPLTVRLTRSTVLLTAIVKDQYGSYVEDARVLVRQDDLRNTTFSLKTDSEGQATHEIARPTGRAISDKYVVLAYQGDAKARPKSVTINAHSNDYMTVELTLESSPQSAVVNQPGSVVPNKNQSNGGSNEEEDERIVDVYGYVKYYHRTVNSTKKYKIVRGATVIWHDQGHNTATYATIESDQELEKYTVSLPEGIYDVEILAPSGFRSTVERNVEIEFGKRRRDIILEKENSSSKPPVVVSTPPKKVERQRAKVTVHVVEERSKRPIPSATITVVRDDGYTFETNSANGSRRLNLTPGRSYQFRVEKKGRLPNGRIGRTHYVATSRIIQPQGDEEGTIWLQPISHAPPVDPPHHPSRPDPPVIIPDTNIIWPRLIPVPSRGPSIEQNPPRPSSPPVIGVLPAKPLPHVK